MRQKLLRQMSGAVLALLLALTFTQILASAQEQAPEAQNIQDTQEQSRQEDLRQLSANARKLEGVWESRVTPRNCQTGDPIPVPPLRGMTIVIRGGAIIGTNANPPTTGGPAFGSWQHLGGRRYITVFRFFRFNPDGSFAGIQRVTRNITLSRDGEHLTSTISFEIFDANDNLIGTGCATETAERVE